jgi:CPA2 family monovalent cation:H+ antiporter-2
MAAADASLYTEGLVLLCGAIVAAPLFKKIGLGTVLGYLAAGIVIGPVLRIITDGEEILHFAELGVVLLLFVIGLGTQAIAALAMRRDIFGLGLAQVMISALAIIGVAWVFAVSGDTWAAAIVIGFGLALSSTAFGIQILERTRRSEHPLWPAILLNPAVPGYRDRADPGAGSLVAPASAADGELDRSTDVAITVGAIIALLVAGRYLLNPLFPAHCRNRCQGSNDRRSTFRGSCVRHALMQVAGLSMAMGAFIAGVMLAESSYRHELEADIEPFRGILLGLFFMAVGLSLDLSVILDKYADHHCRGAGADGHQGAGDLRRMPGLWFDSQHQHPDRRASAAGRRIRIRDLQRGGGGRRVRPVDGLAAGGDRHHIYGADAAGGMCWPSG